MRFSRNWIADYTTLPDDAAELHQALSMLGLVVDDARAQGDDVVLDLDFPSNRPDAMNHLGVARELALALGAPLSMPATDHETVATSTAEVAAVIVEDDDACPRFAARALLDVRVGPSPDWLVERLESIGLRAINNVVDVTNFVMWELGRPMHAYDLDKLDQARLVVRHARPGEKLVTLDEVERELSADDVVIADASEPVGLAGVMGSAASGVTEQTRRVLLECAFFDSVTSRRMARRHSMHTDASHRFERGLSIEGIDHALDRACHLLRDAASVCAGTVTVDNGGSVDKVIELRRARLDGYLGVEIDDATVRTALEGLGFTVDSIATGYSVTVPPRRVDVDREVDLIEEVARLYGYDRIPSSLPALRRRDSRGPEPRLRAERRLRELGSATGLWEAMTYVFANHVDHAPLLEDGAQSVALANPLSEASAVLRSHLIPGLVACLARNRNQGAPRARLFELGRTFRPGPDDTVNERRHLGIAMYGSAAESHFSAPARDADFADLKGTVEVLCARMRWPQPRWEASAHPGLEPGRCAAVQVGDAEGFAGQLAPQYAAALGIDAPVWVFEIDTEDLLSTPTGRVEIEALPRFPSSERDVSLLVADDLEFGAIERLLETLTDLPLVGTRLLDRYAGDDLAAGKIALTLRLTYRDDSRTLTSEEIEAAHAQVVSLLEQSVGAHRR